MRRSSVNGEPIEPESKRYFRKTRFELNITSNVLNNKACLLDGYLGLFNAITPVEILLNYKALYTFYNKEVADRYRLGER